MKKLRHPNIVSFLGACLEKPYFCIVTELLPGGSVEDFLEKRRVEGAPMLSLRRVLDWSRQIATGLNWLHHKGIIHRDLKSGNLLLDAHKYVFCLF